MKSKEGIILTERDLRARERETGIDILRIVAMLMVVMQHCLLHGTLLNHGTDAHRIITDTVYTFCRIAVNVYAAITGYVCIKSKFRLGRILLLYLQVFFYSAVLLSAVCAIQNVSMGEWVYKRFFPISNGTYWYFTSYFCVALLIPFLNAGLNHLNKAQHRLLILVCGILFSLISIGGSLLSKNDPMRAGSGYSAIWLIVMYVMGAYIKLYPEDIKKKYAYLTVYFGCMIISALLRRGAVLISTSEVSYTSYPVSYVSPLMYIGTFCLVAFFSKVKLPKWRPGLKKFIAYASTLTFGVYLIHDNPFIREYYMSGSFKPLASETPFMMLLYLIAGTLAIYVVCSLVDAARKLLFRVVRLDKFTDWAGNTISDSLMNILSGKKKKPTYTEDIFESDD